MRYLAATLLVLGLFASIALPRAFASTGHNCAPPIPPAVPGTLTIPSATPGIVVINELLPLPHSAWNCSETSGYFSTIDAWIELYNPQNQPFNLYTAHAFLTAGSGSNFGTYYMPFGAAIAPYGYLVLFPFTSPTFRFTTNQTFELIIGTTIIDKVTVPLLGPDQSFARTYDGGPNWQISDAPTIDASNGTPPTTSQGTGTGGTGTGSGIGNTPTPVQQAIASGTQPAWNRMQIPAASPTSSTMTVKGPPTTLVTTGPSPSATGGLSIVQRIALTFIVIALIVVIFVCWKWKLYKFRS